MELNNCACEGRPVKSAYQDKSYVVYAYEIFCKKCGKSTAMHKSIEDAATEWNSRRFKELD